MKLSKPVKCLIIEGDRILAHPAELPAFTKKGVNEWMTNFDYDVSSLEFKNNVCIIEHRFGNLILVRQ